MFGYWHGTPETGMGPTFALVICVVKIKKTEKPQHSNVKIYLSFMLFNLKSGISDHCYL